MSNMHVPQITVLTQEDGSAQIVVKGEAVCWKNPEPSFATSKIMLGMLKEDFGDGPFNPISSICIQGDEYYLLYSPILRKVLSVPIIFFQKCA